MHVGIWKNKKHATNWFQKKTCKDMGKQAIMGDRQNMRPSFLPQLLLRSKCASGLLTFCLAWEPEDSCKDTLDVRNRREWGDRQNMLPSFLPGFYSEAVGLPVSLLFTSHGTQKKHARRMGKMQNMPPWLLLRGSCASSPLAFCPTQLHDGVSGSVKSDRRHSALRPCWTQSKIGTGSNFQKLSLATSTI